MSIQSDKDEMQAAIDLILGRLDRLRRDVRRKEECNDPRRLALFQGEAAEVLADLERFRDQTAAALASAGAGCAASRAYLSVGQLANRPATDRGTVVFLDQIRSADDDWRKKSR